MSHVTLAQRVGACPSGIPNHADPARAEWVSFHRRMNDLLARALPRVERAELPGGHSASRTASAAFNEKLRAFLGRYE